MVARGVGAVLLALIVLVGGAMALGAALPAPVMVAFMGMCAPGNEGTCIADMRSGHVLRWTRWARVNSDWLPGAPNSVYTADIPGDIYLYDGDTHTRLTNDPVQNTLPRWSPDGEHIAYTQVHSANDIDLYVMEHDGSNPRPLQTSLVAVNSAPVWAPDGRTLAYFTQLLDNNTQIWRLSLDGGEPFPLGSTLGNDASWSPDGTRLVYTGGRGYTQIIADAATGNVLSQRTVANRPDVAYWVAWSPDGAYIAYVYQQRNRVQRSEFVEVYNLASGQARRLMPRPHTMFSKPVWADEQRLVQPVYRGTGDPYHNAILLLDVARGPVRSINVLDMRQFIGVVKW